MLLTKTSPSSQLHKEWRDLSNDFHDNDKSLRTHHSNPAYVSHHQHPSEALAVEMSARPVLQCNVDLTLPGLLEITSQNICSNVNNNKF